MTKPTLLSPAPSKGIRKSLLFSSSLLAGVITLGTFTSAVEAQELDIDHDFLQNLYEQYTALNISTEEQSQTSVESLEKSDSSNDELPEEIADELNYIKSQLLKMIELAGGQNVLEQLDSENMSVEQLDTIFNALIEQQLINEDLNKTVEVVSVDETEEVAEEEETAETLDNVETEEVVEEQDNSDTDETAVVEEVIEELEEEVTVEEPKVEAPKETPKAETPKAETPKETPKVETPVKTDAKPIVYVVKSGDTLGKIAQLYNTTATKLASLNNLANANRISVGQVLAINTAGVSEAKTPQPTTPGNLNQATTPTAFINQIAGYAQEVAAQNGLYASVMIAQASLESGYGRSSLSAHPNYNLFGIKGSYNGQSVAKQTKEYYSHTGWITIIDHFKKYPSYEASLNDNARLLRRGLSWNPEFYAGAWVERTNSYRDATAWLQGRYATDPTYASKLNNLIQLYDLTRFDVPSGTVTKPVPNPTPAPAPTPSNPTNPYNETTTYKVVRGDTLSKIAREFKTTVQALKAANHLSTDLIFVNQTLTVPKLAVAQPAPEQPNEDTKPETKPETSKPETGTPVPVDSGQVNNHSYTVVSGDTLTGIARRFNTTVNAIRQSNTLSSDRIFVNQKLTITSAVPVEKPVVPPAENTNTQTITVKRGDTLYQLARTYNTTVAELRAVNNLTADTIYVGQTLSVQKAADTTVTPPISDSTGETPKGTAQYTVKSGDTLYGLAREFKTTVSHLRTLNNLKTDMIRIGAVLTVPADKPAAPEVQKPVLDQTSETSVYTIKSGDTLSQIARDFKTTVAKLRADNNLTNDRIFVGQKLMVSGISNKPQKPVESQKPVVQVEYVVKSGDTLTQIARTHNTTVNELMSLNSLSDSNRLSVGQRLIVTKGQLAESKPESPKPAPTAPAQPSGASYTVKSGDTLSQIARTHNMTVAEVRELNDLENADRIVVGQRLVLSAEKAETPKPTVPTPAPATPVSGNYTVKSGDTLSQVARSHNMTLAQLLELNKLENADRISIGQRLVVTTEKAEAPKPVAPTPAPVLPVSGNYTVKAGDTLSQIARSHNMTVAQLLELNKLENADRISIGQRLVVTSEKAERPIPAAPTPQPAPVKTDESNYVVKAGDTLSQLAKDFEVTLSQIKEWNNLTSDIIFVNQSLVFKQTTETKPVSDSSQSSHTVSAGETLSHVARLYNLTVKELKELNYLTSDLIFVNQSLVVTR
ncbi:LysM peptidoglycan-binding domain-containing protein [Alkalibacterium olivapovliticus]|uniref:Peptidoglycan hydrolase n=1 Tax=Alkalibacterium olivapovliticus TaxID=99907 RepID=A0A2T0W6B7_9LACT|nr:LysM peptidoglycan-binding domain-containing protein [Alkalibacterium olivapovliticus]PRY82193.1 flagellum-specific peptidoglycan hydrolase FlgJ [Alkalibacterium olivapovliticus]